MPLVNPSFDKLSTGLHRIVIEQRKNKSCLGVDIPYWCYISELVKFDRKKVNEFLLNLEKEIIHKYPAGNDGKVNLKDSLTARYQHYNFLTLRFALLSEVQKHIKKTIKGCIDSFNQGGRKIPVNDLWIICWYNVLRKGEKLYSGRVDEMISSHGFFELKADKVDVLIKILENDDAFGNIKTEEGIITAFLNKPMEASAFNKLMFNKGVTLSHLVKRKESLEEQFLQLTNNN